MRLLSRAAIVLVALLVSLNASAEAPEAGTRPAEVPEARMPANAFPAPEASAEAPNIEASAATAELQRQLQQIDSLQGRFEQTVETDGGDAIAASSGTFKLLQPGFFFWRISQPDEQLLIAAGDSLWHYDVELETATRRNIAAERSQSPLAVLSASEEQLQALYSIEQLAAQRFSLEPQFEGASFVRLELTLEEGIPVSMAVIDHLQQVTQIRFFEITLNPHLMADEFSFTPPDGVDVYVQ